jgi:hypothetical protein
MTKDERSSARLLLEAYELMEIVPGRWLLEYEQLNEQFERAQDVDEMLRIDDEREYMEAACIMPLDDINGAVLGVMAFELNDGRAVAFKSDERDAGAVTPEAARLKETDNDKKSRTTIKIKRLGER